jgi:hypothetical protein
LGQGYLNRCGDGVTTLYFISAIFIAVMIINYFGPPRSGRRAMINEHMEWFKRFAAAYMRWVNFNFDRIVSDAVKRERP